MSLYRHLCLKLAIAVICGVIFFTRVARWHGSSAQMNLRFWVDVWLSVTAPVWIFTIFRNNRILEGSVYVYYFFIFILLKTETCGNGTMFVFSKNIKNKKSPWFSIFPFRGRKWINSLNVRFPCVGGNETPLSTDWSSKDQTVLSSCRLQFCATE